MAMLRAVAGEKDAGRKLKYFVRGDLGVSYTQFSSLKMSGGVRVNGEAALANTLLKAGDVVEVLWPEDAPAQAVVPEFLPVNVVFESDDFYIVDKPAPLPCQCSQRQTSGTLENRLAARFGEPFIFRPLNRLDKGTSGLMVVARHAHAQDALQRDLHTDDFVREYLAVVEGAPQAEEGWIDAPIRKAAGATIRREVGEGGQNARTHFCVEKRGALSLVRLRLLTGRTHQIRVYMAYMGCPVFGDFLYGTESPRLPGRFALHSAYIAFRHPESGERMAFASPLPEELARLLIEDAALERAARSEDVF